MDRGDNSRRQPNIEDRRPHLQVSISDTLKQESTIALIR